MALPAALAGLGVLDWLGIGFTAAMLPDILGTGAGMVDEIAGTDLIGKKENAGKLRDFIREDLDYQDRMMTNQLVSAMADQRALAQTRSGSQTFLPRMLRREDIQTEALNDMLMQNQVALSKAAVRDSEPNSPGSEFLNLVRNMGLNSTQRYM